MMMDTNKFKNGVVSKGGEFFEIETEEERAYLEELHINFIVDLEWEMWAIQNGIYDEDEDEEYIDEQMEEEQQTHQM